MVTFLIFQTRIPSGWGGEFFDIFYPTGFSAKEEGFSGKLLKRLETKYFQNMVELQNVSMKFINIWEENVEKELREWAQLVHSYDTMNGNETLAKEYENLSKSGFKS